MNENKILHVMILDKFLAPYIDFVDEHFGRENHHYVFITSEKYEFGLTPEHKVEFLHTDDDIFITLLEYMKVAKRIILHGLWRDKVDILLYFNQELLKKCFWVMWGGDFYFPETKSKIKHKVIKEMGHLITFIKDDYKLAQKWYGSHGEYMESFTYPSNLYKDYNIKEKENSTINILLGNSATETNNHIEILNSLSKYKNENIKIFTPLSYGNVEYGNLIVQKGSEIFGDKFIPFLQFIPFEEYMNFLSAIDIAIFNHERQQAFGNIISLLGMGKKVYIHKNSTLNGVFNEYNLEIFHLDNLDLILLDEQIKNTNISNTKANFSKETLVKSLKQYLL